MAYLLSDTSFWTFLGLILFFGILIYFGVPGVIGKALDERADAIRKELDDARKLREEAQEILASYKRKQAEAEEEADAIVKRAKAEADYLRETAQDEISARIERRTAQAEQRIAQAEAAAAKEVRTLATDIAIDAAEVILSENLSKTQRNALLKGDIAALKDRLN